MKQILPPGIKKGDTIGIVALSAPSSPELFKRGVEAIRASGYEVKVALDPTGAYGKDTYMFSSDTPVNRARALGDLFADPKVSAIIAARGAYGSMEILPLLDYKKIKSNPKFLCGFSDATAVLLAIAKQSGIITVHGATASGAFAKEDPLSIKSRDALLRLLGGDLNAGLHGTKFDVIKVGEASGLLIGGSLSMIVSLLGTPWQPDFSGNLLFLEEVGEKPYRVARMLMQLKLSGALNQAAGVIIGELKDCTHALGPSVSRVVEEIFAEFKYPIFRGGPFGHGELNMPIPIGAKAKMSNGAVSVEC